MMREKAYREEFWGEIVKAADSIIVIIDPSGGIQLFNQKAQELTGYTEEEILGRQWVDMFVPPSHQAGVQKVLHSLLQGKKASRFAEYPIISKGGNEILIAWDRVFVKDKQGKGKALLSIGHDLTLSRILEEERYQTQTILDSIADGVFTVDQNFRITSFNKAATTITGFSKEEALGQYCRDILRSSQCMVGCPLQEAMDTGKNPPSAEVNILNRQNREVHVNFRTTVWRDQNDTPIGGVGVFRDLTPLVELKKEIEKGYSFQDIISKSKAFLDLFRILPDIAKSDATVLITGESGTGKELVAAALHNLSGRKEKPFIKLNCGALPETLLESELFGYKKGAFTDARQDKPGRFKLAEGGTLFFDEIGDISQGTQVKLLRVLETKEYEPLGGTRTEKANIRIIAATNRDLLDEVKSGEFREDLYYRINLFNIYIPPLRERPEDIPLLLDHFVMRFNHLKDRNISGFTHSALNILLNHDYSGNVRELQNIVEHAFILCKTGRIGPECLPAYLRNNHSLRAQREGRQALGNFEKEMIVEMLKKHRGNLKETAEEMGLHRSTLWRKMKKMKISRTIAAPPER